MHFDLIVVGSGSGNSLLTPELEGWKVAIVERGVFGGTCINRGCVPSKMLVLPADIVVTARHAGALGVDLAVEQVRWPDIVRRVFARIDPISVDGERYRDSQPNVTLFRADGRFVADRTIELRTDTGAPQTISGDQVVIAAGSTPYIPPVPGLDEVGFHTSDTIMRLPEPPGRLLILGGGYIAAEMAHVFDAAGTQVTIVHRKAVMLGAEDDDVNQRFTELAAARYQLLAPQTVHRFSPSAEGIRCDIGPQDGEPQQTVVVDTVLVATGRTPNGGELAVEAAGVERDAGGYVVVDEYQRTTAPGVWALGDVSNHLQLKHTANAEARAVAHNLAHPDELRPADLEPVPHAVFSSPQIASSGAKERDLIAAGRPYLVGRRDYGDTAYGWALEDRTSFAKVIADPATRQLLGAHILGSQAATLLHPLLMGMRYGLTVEQLARDVLYIHPALTEVVEQALLAVPAS